uniref:Uncharacterized protein n=1 Tax=Glossina brevipalpis TaxID=37001 RepID=A0A1A9WMQ3_9MUSC
METSSVSDLFLLLVLWSFPEAVSTADITLASSSSAFTTITSVSIEYLFTFRHTNNHIARKQWRRFVYLRKYIATNVLSELFYLKAFVRYFTVLALLYLFYAQMLILNSRLNLE